MNITELIEGIIRNEDCKDCENYDRDGHYCYGRDIGGGDCIKVHQLLSLVVQEAEICPGCGGTGEFTWNPIKHDYPITKCEACHGTGKTEPKTILDLIKEALK